MVWKLNNGPITLPPTSVGPIVPLLVESYIDHFEVTSICGGTATMVHFPGVWCADQPAVAYDAWVRYRTAVLAGVSLALKAPILREGICPTIRESFQGPCIILVADNMAPDH